MKKTIKTIDAVNVFSAVEEAKLTKLEGDEVFNVLSAIQALEAISKEYKSFTEKAAEKLKPENFEDLQKRAQNFNSLSNEEKIQTNKELSDFNTKVENVIKSKNEEAVEIEFEALSKESFSRLIKSNDFTVKNMLIIKNILCE